MPSVQVAPAARVLGQLFVTSNSPVIEMPVMATAWSASESSEWPLKREVHWIVPVELNFTTEMSKVPNEGMAPGRDWATKTLPAELTAKSAKLDATTVPDAVCAIVGNSAPKSCNQSRTPAGLNLAAMRSSLPLGGCGLPPPA